MGAAKMKPRDSMPITLSIRSPFQRFTKASITSWKVAASERTGVRSLKTIPCFGKAGTSRIRARTASIMGADISTGSGEEQERVPRPGPLPHLEVEVRAGGPAGLPHLRDGLPANDPRPFLHQHRR